MGSYSTWGYSGVKGGYKGVRGLLQLCYNVWYNDVTDVLKGSYKGVTMVLQMHC